MEELDTVTIIEQARRLRAEEIQRVQGVIWARTRLLAGLAGESLMTGLGAVAEFIRPLFSWNPRERWHS